jgi:Flp pilus assembly protein TadG
VIRRPQSTQSRERGQAILEFALVLPLFLILLFALFDFSRLVFTYVSLSNGARELAREASISTNWSSSSAVNAFKNYTIVAGGQNSTTDQVTIAAGSATCARTEDTGGTCTGTDAPTQVACSLPLSASCALPTPTQGGFVQVNVAYTFQFNPLFQTRLDGIVDVSFMRPTAVLTTQSRAYVE